MIKMFRYYTKVMSTIILSVECMPKTTTPRMTVDNYNRVYEITCFPQQLLSWNRPDRKLCSSRCRESMPKRS